MPTNGVRSSIEKVYVQRIVIVKKMISSKEAADRLGVSQLRVQQLCRQRRIVGAKLLGRM